MSDDRRHLPLAPDGLPALSAALPPGLRLPDGWRVAAVAAGAGRLSVFVARGADEAVELTASPPEGSGDSGPFDLDGVRLCYQPTPVAFEAFRGAGHGVAARLREAAGEAGALPMLRAWMAQRAWRADALAAPRGAGAPVTPGTASRATLREEARRLLVDRRDVALPLGRLLAPEALPPWACVDPWTRLEFSTSRSIGPCCSDYQVSPRPLVEGAPLEAQWNSAVLRGFRRAMTSGRTGSHCCVTCPELAGALSVPARLELRGGPARFVEAQLDLVDAVLDGEEHLRCGPLVVCFPTTTYCNYDCLMCDFGVEGTLSDELPASFYASLRGWSAGLQRLEALGGEPLASPVFREYLATEDFSAYPGLEISLTTNGSYLTPRELDRYARAPLANLVISLNAATPGTYAAVNRGLPWERIRANLAHLLARRRDRGGSLNAIVYSMVLLKRNVAEIRAFAELARGDGVRFRYMLPMHDRNGQSIMTDRGAMTEALAALEDVLSDAPADGLQEDARAIAGEASVLRRRLDRGVMQPLPER